MNKDLEKEIMQITANLEGRQAVLQAKLLEKINELSHAFSELKQAEELLGYVKRGGKIPYQGGYIIDGSSFAATMDGARHYLSGEGVGEGRPGWREANPEELADLVKQTLKSDQSKASLQAAYRKIKERRMGSDNKRSQSPGPVVSFYREKGTDGSGRKLSQILAWDDFKLEAYHDFIQWLFPSTEGSRAVPGSPVLQQAEIQAFNSDPALQARLLEAFKRMLAFYKFDYSEGAGEIKISPIEGWSSRKPHWLNKGNHNHHRITRILKCLSILGLPEQAQAFSQALAEVYQNYKDDIGYNTFQYWKRASNPAST